MADIIVNETSGSKSVSELTITGADNVIVYGGTEANPITLTVDEDFECMNLTLGNNTSADDGQLPGKLLIVDDVSNCRRIVIHGYFYQGERTWVSSPGAGHECSEVSQGKYSIPDDVYGLKVETAVSSGVYEEFGFVGNVDVENEHTYSNTEEFVAWPDVGNVQKVPIGGLTGKDGLGIQTANHVVDLYNSSQSHTMPTDNSWPVTHYEYAYTGGVPYCPNVQADLGCFEMGTRQQRVYSNGVSELTVSGDYSISEDGKFHSYKSWAQFTLNGAISDTDTSLVVDEDISGMPDSGYICIDDELIMYGAKDNGTKTFSSLSRGEHVTTAAAHSDEAVVNEGGFIYYHNMRNKYWWLGGTRGSLTAEFGKTNYLTTPTAGGFRYQAYVGTGRKVKCASIHFLSHMDTSNQRHWYLRGRWTATWTEIGVYYPTFGSTAVYANLYLYTDKEQIGAKEFTNCSIVWPVLYFSGNKYDVGDKVGYPNGKVKFIDCYLLSYYGGTTADGSDIYFENGLYMGFQDLRMEWCHVEYKGEIYAWMFPIIDLGGQEFTHNIYVHVGTKMHCVQTYNRFEADGSNFDIHYPGDVINLSELEIYHTARANADAWSQTYPYDFPKTVWSWGYQSNFGFGEVDNQGKPATGGAVQLPDTIYLFCTQIEFFPYGAYDPPAQAGASPSPTVWQGNSPVITLWHSMWSSFTGYAFYTVPKSGRYNPCVDIPFIYIGGNILQRVNGFYVNRGDDATGPYGEGPAGYAPGVLDIGVPIYVNGISSIVNWQDSSYQYLIIDSMFDLIVGSRSGTTGADLPCYELTTSGLQHGIIDYDEFDMTNITTAWSSRIPYYGWYYESGEFHQNRYSSIVVETYPIPAFRSTPGLKRRYAGQYWWPFSIPVDGAGEVTVSFDMFGSETMPPTGPTCVFGYAAGAGVYQRQLASNVSIVYGEAHSFSMTMEPTKAGIIFLMVGTPDFHVIDNLEVTGDCLPSLVANFDSLRYQFEPFPELSDTSPTGSSSTGPGIVYGFSY